MEKKSPVYTLYNECQDCYKCVRRCPVKAIRIQNGHAGVLPERCIACGRCVAPCPSHAKQVRNDVAKVKELLRSNKKVYVSLAPSWRAAFDCNSSIMIAVLKKLGFTGVSETALGAQAVSIQTAKILNEAQSGFFISSACPVIVDYVRLYKSEMTPYITQLASPALTHARILQDTFGSDISVVFIGPCIGKKNESDRHPDLIDVALTFEELKVWLKDEDIRFDDVMIDETHTFLPERSFEGALYPIDGGMNETIRKVGVKPTVQLINICSLDLFKNALAKLDVKSLKYPIFIEALACDGGCMNGPCVASVRSDFANISKVMGHTKQRKEIPLMPQAVVEMKYEPNPVSSKVYPLDEIRNALRRIGKYLPQDELNCAGCGYQTCQEMAKALLDGDAEPSMCVSYMRQIATRKVAAMLKSMPSAMVMLDANLNILEANEAFIKFFAGSMKDIFLSSPERLVGLPVKGMLDWTPLFKMVLKTGKEIHKEHYKFNKKCYDVHLFPIEDGLSIGAIITDITGVQNSKELVAQKAKEVINKNISIVQEIACLLGEHMVETETLLSAIADDYNEAEE